MKLLRLPLIYFPTTTLIIDDDKACLTNLRFSIDKTLSFKTCCSVLNFTSLINNCYQTLPLSLQIYSGNEDIDIYPANNKCLNNFDLASYYWEIFDNRRFNKISVVIVDYEMATMNGFDLFKNLQNNFIKI